MHKSSRKTFTFKAYSTCCVLTAKVNKLNDNRCIGAIILGKLWIVVELDTSRNNLAFVEISTFIKHRTIA